MADGAVRRAQSMSNPKSRGPPEIVGFDNPKSQGEAWLFFVTAHTFSSIFW